VRVDGRVTSQATVVAIGISSDGGMCSASTSARRRIARSGRRFSAAWSSVGCVGSAWSSPMRTKG
jgi:hypothetical protein